MRLGGKIALVTDAAQGIGRGIALRLAKDGADIALVDLKTDKLQDVRSEIEALGRRATLYAADVSNRDAVYRAIDHAEATLGGFDIMINNAGIAPVKPLADVMPEDLERILRIAIQGVL